MTVREFFKQAKPSLSINRSDPYHDVKDYEALMRSDFESIFNGIIESLETPQSSTDRSPSQWIDISLYGFPPAMPNDHYSERVLVTDGVDCEVTMYEHNYGGSWVGLGWCKTPTQWRSLRRKKRQA